MGELTNDFIRQRALRLNLKQVDIAKELARRKGGYPENYKGIVHKWFKTDQEPGKEYLLELAEILNVNVESILRGKYVQVQDSRATAYSAAFTGDKHLIDRLFGSLESSEVRVTTPDEYGKSFIDYVLEFDNYTALKVAIDSNYCLVSPFSVNELTANDNDKSLSLIKMIIREDDIEVFSKAVSRIIPISNDAPAGSFCYRFQMPYELCDEILKTDTIFHYFIDPSPLSKEESEHLNGIVYRIETSPLDNIPSLTPCFNSLLKRAFELNNQSKVSVLLKTAEDYINSISLLYEPIKDELCIDSEGAFRFKGTRAILAFVPNINNGLDINNHPEAKTILEFQNCFHRII